MAEDQSMKQAPAADSNGEPLEEKAEPKAIIVPESEDLKNDFEATTIMRHVGDYVDDHTRRISEHEVVYGPAPEDFTRFIGHATLSVPHPSDPMQPPMQFPCPFQIPDVDTIEEAFAAFNLLAGEAGNAAGEELRQRFIADQKAQQQRIVRATSIPGGPPHPGLGLVQ